MAFPNSYEEGDTRFSLKCALCQEDLNQPKQLQACFHIFCKSCFPPVKEDGTYLCPLQFCHVSRPSDSPQASASSISACQLAAKDSAHSEISSYKELSCPICRNTDICDHEYELKILLQDKLRLKETCEVLDHDDEILVAFCMVCEKPVCKTCSSVKHKSHETDDIGDAVSTLLPDLQRFHNTITDLRGMFQDAAKARDAAETDFKQHLEEVRQEIINRKASLLRQIEDTFSRQMNELEETAQKQGKLNHRQRAEMISEQKFLQTAVQLAEKVLEDAEERVARLRGMDRHQYMVEVARVRKGLKSIVEGFQGKHKKVSSDSNAGLPQVIVEKRLVLPAPSCMRPDLSILQKVGVEDTVLHLAFYLAVETEALLHFSIVPLTQTAALVTSKPTAYSLEAVKYSDEESGRSIRSLAKGGECYLAAAPGDGIIVTVNNDGCGDHVKNTTNEVLFWEGAKGTLGGNMKSLMKTALPPRGVAVTRDNHVVVCMAAGHDHPRSCIVLMTLQGDLLCKRDFPSSSADQHGDLQYPWHVTVNINNDICVTDKKDRAVFILNHNLQVTQRFINPYSTEELNSKFLPWGICHDSFGRLIVADPDNDAVLRIVYMGGDTTPKWQVLLKNKQGRVEDLDSPKLVALGLGQWQEVSRLWVVCRNIIQVFDYMDKE